MKLKRERRSIIGRVETRALTDEEKSAGYIGALTGVIPLNSDSEPIRDCRLNNGQPFVERIAPQAFAAAADVVGVAGHTDDPLAAFGRTGANLLLIETATELRWDAKLPNTSAARDLLELGEKKIIRGTSFEFEVGAEDRWEQRADGTAVRTVVRGKLSRVNPVIDPAYTGSELSVSMRGGRGPQEERDYNPYLEHECWNDGTVTVDATFARNALYTEIAGLTDAQNYLRARPEGVHAEYARAEVAESGRHAAAMLAWLVANGSTVDPEFLARATKVVTEARSESPGSGLSSLSPSTDATRERRRRALSLAPVSPLVA